MLLEQRLSRLVCGYFDGEYISVQSKVSKSLTILIDISTSMRPCYFAIQLVFKSFIITSTKEERIR